MGAETQKFEYKWSRAMNEAHWWNQQAFVFILLDVISFYFVSVKNWLSFPPGPYRNGWPRILRSSATCCSSLHCPPRPTFPVPTLSVSDGPHTLWLVTNVGSQYITADVQLISTERDIVWHHKAIMKRPRWPCLLSICDRPSSAGFLDVSRDVLMMVWEHVDLL